MSWIEDDPNPHLLSDSLAWVPVGLRVSQKELLWTVTAHHEMDPKDHGNHQTPPPFSRKSARVHAPILESNRKNNASPCTFKYVCKSTQIQWFLSSSKIQFFLGFLFCVLLILLKTVNFYLRNSIAMWFKNYCNAELLTPSVALAPDAI